MKAKAKCIILALTVVFSINYAQAQLGAQVGYSFSDQEDMRGFHLGPTYEWQIKNNFSLQSGLLYNYLSGSAESKTFGMDYDRKAHYLDVPVRAVASLPFGGNWKAFLFAGPNFNIGVSDKVQDRSTDKEIDLFSTSANDGLWDQKSRFNLQLGGGVGVMYNNIGLRIGYDQGIIDVYKNQEIEAKYRKSSDLKIGLFYNFPNGL